MGISETKSSNLSSKMHTITFCQLFLFLFVKRRTKRPLVSNSETLDSGFLSSNRFQLHSFWDLQVILVVGLNSRTPVRFD